MLVHQEIGDAVPNVNARNIKKYLLKTNSRCFTTHIAWHLLGSCQFSITSFLNLLRTCHEPRGDRALYLVVFHQLACACAKQKSRSNCSTLGFLNPIHFVALTLVVELLERVCLAMQLVELVCMEQALKLKMFCAQSEASRPQPLRLPFPCHSELRR